MCNRVYKIDIMNIIYNGKIMRTHKIKYIYKNLN